MPKQYHICQNLTNTNVFFSIRQNKKQKTLNLLHGKNIKWSIFENYFVKNCFISSTRLTASLSDPMKQKTLSPGHILKENIYLVRSLVTT